MKQSKNINNGFRRTAGPGLAAILLLSGLFSSCFGVNLDISLNENGSGTITLEYKISRSLDNLGKLDGNERWNTIPVGKADFERSLDRLPDIKLISFSSNETNDDLVIRAKMEFQKLSGLFSFLDARGGKSSFSGEKEKGIITINLSEPGNFDNQHLLKLITEISRNYEVALSMSFPAEGTMRVFDTAGKPLSPDREYTAKGKKVSCIFSLSEVLTSANGINVEMAW